MIPIVMKQLHASRGVFDKIEKSPKIKHGHRVKRDYCSDFFFNPHELTKIFLQKFYEILWCQIEPFGIAN